MPGKPKFKSAVPPSDDEELDEASEESAADDLDLDEDAGSEESDGSDVECSDESEAAEDSEEEEEAEEEKPKKKSKKSAPPLDEEDAAKGTPEEQAPVSAPDKIGDLMEDRRYALRPKAKNTRDHLAAQTLVQTMIPRMDKESKDATHYFNINGFAFYIRKGVFQMVPSDVAQMISDTYGQDARIVAEHPLNLANNTAAAKEFSR